MARECEPAKAVYLVVAALGIGLALADNTENLPLRQDESS